MNRTPSNGRAGLTLLELLLVMVLIAMIVGGGLGMFTALDLGKRQAAGLVRNVLRSAQNTAIASAAPARVRIDREQGSLVAEAMLTVGTYRFEDRRMAGFGPAGEAEPEDFDERGFLGACFRPAGRLRSTATIPLERDPAFDFTLGFSIELALFREGEGGGRVFTLGPAELPTLALELGKNGALRARMRTRIGGLESDRPGGSVVLQSGPGLVARERWVQVRMRYDRAHFELMLDGARVASQEEQGYVWRVDAPLTLSDGAVPFPGRIDELVIGAMQASEPTRLPETVHFAADVPAMVQFAASGGLDREVHFDPPRLALEFPDGSRETVLVGLYGSVE